MMQYSSCIVFSWSRSSKCFFFLLSDEGRDFYGNEKPSHGVYMWNEALDRVNVYWLFIIFFFLPCFKFQFELSSAQPFISLGVAAIYTLSFNLFLSDVVLGYQFTSCLLSVRLLKGCGMNHMGHWLWWIWGKTLFSLSPTKHPPFLFNVCTHSPFHPRQDARENFPSVDIINLN